MQIPATRKKQVVLFVCTGNSARSQMAEGLLRHLAGERYEVHSAGLEPRGVHPLTHRVMSELGIDTSGHHSKHVTEYLGRGLIHHAIIVCDGAQKRCPSLFPFATRLHFWPFEDPAAAEGEEDLKIARFRKVRDQIQQKIREHFLETRSSPA